MSKYQTLSLHLATLRDTAWVAKFQEIEAVLGFPQPRSAYSYPAWWSNQSGDGHIQSQAWQSAGWRTGELDLAKQQISFFRQEGGLTEQRDVGKSPSVSHKEGLTIAEAKAGIAEYYDVSPENVEITIRG